MRKPDEIIQSIEENKKNLEFLSSGFSILDKYLDGGFMKKELVLIGAFTGIGKSIFSGQILYQVATQGFKTGYFSLEISAEMIIARLIGQLANIKPNRIIAGLLEYEEFDRKSLAKANILTFNDLIEIYDDIYLLSTIEENIKNSQYEFVVIDFIQNIQLKRNLDEYNRLSFISIELQRIAKENNCCILVLSQLSNKVGREGAKIIEYKGSGSIAMVADLGFILHREELASIDSNSRQIVKLDLMKNRRGISGQTFTFEFMHPGGGLKEII